MSELKVDLWPSEIGEDAVRAPVAILREQAAFLGKKTKNIVEAEVSASTRRSVVVNDGVKLFEFSHDFNLRVSALSNYRYTLFSIYHDLPLYPVFISWADHTFRCNNEDELLSQLQQIFSAEHTLRVIRSLITQASG